MNQIRIATRQSALALWQANQVKSELEKLYPKTEISLLELSTQGDIMLDTALAKIGGKGLFVKELEHALLNGEADIAVHSLKDVPMQLPDSLILSCICERQSPFDALVSNRYNSIEQLPQSAVVGTSSLRRQMQLLRLRPDLNIKLLRGNVITRLSKLDNDQYDAIILAAAGLQRLGFASRISQLLSTDQCLPAVGQGALAIETRDDPDWRALLHPLHHPPTVCCVTAERALNNHLQGGCQVPIAAYARFQDSQLILDGLVGNADGSRLIKARQTLSINAANLPDSSRLEQLGIDTAKQLIAQGAAEILATFEIDGVGS